MLQEIVSTGGKIKCGNKNAIKKPADCGGGNTE